MRFHLDENVTHAIAAGLTRRGIDVTTSTEAGLLLAADEEQIAYALAQGRVILTQDRDMLILAGSGTPHAGIGYWKPGSRSVGDIIRQVLRMHSSLTEEEMLGRVEFL